MGYWGVENLEGDEPREFLAQLVNGWEHVIDHVLAGELREAATYVGPDVNLEAIPGLDAINSVVMPTVEVILAVTEKLPCDYLPNYEKATNWSTLILGLVENQGRECWGADFEKRRSVIKRTLDELRSRCG